MIIQTGLYGVVLVKTGLYGVFIVRTGISFLTGVSFISTWMFQGKLKIILQVLCMHDLWVSLQLGGIVRSIL